MGCIILWRVEVGIYKDGFECRIARPRKRHLGYNHAPGHDPLAVEPRSLTSFSRFLSACTSVCVRGCARRFLTLATAYTYAQRQRFRSAVRTLFDMVELIGRPPQWMKSSLVLLIHDYNNVMIVNGSLLEYRCSQWLYQCDVVSASNSRLRATVNDKRNIMFIPYNDRIANDLFKWILLCF